MRRILWSRLRSRPGRTAVLFAGILLASTAFTVLTAASKTSQLRTSGAVSAHFRASYDILVRPKGASSRIEQQTGTVQPDFLSGIYGGITLNQYRQIARIPGVDVAAPIAMIGYSLPSAPIAVALPASPAGTRQLYRVTTTWVSSGGASRVAQPPTYVYVTPNPLSINPDGAAVETLPGGAKATVCPANPASSDPFGAATQAGTWCWSRTDGLGQAGSETFEGLSGSKPGFAVEWSFPLLIAAVDPTAEARLDGLDRAVTSGSYLSETAGPTTVSSGSGPKVTTFPVLASTASGVGEYSETTLNRLADPTQPPDLSLSEMANDDHKPGAAVLTTKITAQDAYDQLLTLLEGGADYFPAVNQYWNVRGVTYRQGGASSLVPATVANPASVWTSALSGTGYVTAPMDNSDTQYRSLSEHQISQTTFTGRTLPNPLPRLVGRFDQSRIRSFDPLSEVPLGPYQPTVESPADATTAKALGGNLLPDLNLGGLVSQPPQLITTLDALPAMENNQLFSGDTHAADPISVVRVRVAGVTGPDPVSLERIRIVAQQIALRTGLDVDIVTGSSPSPRQVDLPPGRYGRPALQLDEKWVQKGVAVAILHAVDRKSVALFVLVLVVCALFVANSATAAARSRRQELGILATLGWTRPRLFALVLGELALIGATAGLLGMLVSRPLSDALGFQASWAWAALAVPVATVLAVAAGSVPAWLASRADPVDAIRPQALPVGRRHRLGGLTGMALVNVLRNPGRTALAALSLAIGVAGLTVLTAVTLTFRGVVVGSLLGNAVALQIRGVDYVAAVATATLGVIAIADTLTLNMLERAPELATIRSFGWSDPSMDRLVLTEGAIIGGAGAVVGAATGVAAAAEFSRQLPGGLAVVAVAAAAVATAVTVGAALVPARIVRRLPIARTLGDE